MSGSTVLSADQVEQLLPALPHLAANIKEFGMPQPRELEMLLLGLDLDQPWMHSELEKWAHMLIQARNERDEHLLAYVTRGLRMRGVPEASAILSVDCVAESEQRQEAVVESHARSDVLVIKPGAEIIGFGLMEAGAAGTRTLMVEGGPGSARVNSSRASVLPDNFGPGPTELTVSVQPGADSSLLLCPLALVAGDQRVDVDIIAEWKSLPRRSEELPPTPPRFDPLSPEQNPDPPPQAPPKVPQHRQAEATPVEGKAPTGQLKPWPVERLKPWPVGRAFKKRSE